MRNIKLTVTYDGTSYRGWQVQDNGPTVQGTLEEAILKALGKKCRVHGASRTDAGAHARAQVCHFKTSSAIPASRLPLALNAVLPKDIAVTAAREMPREFHARFDASGKRYSYRIFNARVRDPLVDRYTWFVPFRLDVPLIRKEAALVTGTHDFRSFQAADKRERSSVRTLKRVSVSAGGGMITLTYDGDGFLYNMVRNLTGTLIDVARGYILPGSIAGILEARDRRQAGPTAPAKGLVLEEVYYN